MKQLILAAFFAVTLLLPSTVMGHDAKLHKGKATVGEVVSMTRDQAEVKIASGTVKVKFNAKTKFEHSGQAVDQSHVQKGEHVTIFGTKLASGDLVATEVQMGNAAANHETDHSKMNGMDHSKMKSATPQK